MISIGDCSREETRAYFVERHLHGVPPRLRKKLEFEDLYRVFGGRLAHIAEYVSDFGEFQSATPLEILLTEWLRSSQRQREYVR